MEGDRSEGHSKIYRAYEGHAQMARGRQNLRSHHCDGRPMDRTSCLKNWEKGELQDGEGGRTLFKNANDVTIFGVERQSVDIIWRGSASDSDNVVSCQVYVDKARYRATFDQM